ncbi:MAG TPA: alpha/beta hydrolase [Actinomycetota bacterium]|nr:alpha/beta hydrolase [Actinomycetota bacterium]
MKTRLVTVPGAQLQVAVWGTGEPIVFIQTALTADELQPIADAAALEGYCKVLYYRRGYAGSSPVEGPGSITRDAADCLALLHKLDIECAHVVGLSYSGAVALQLAADAPKISHSLTLIETPPVHTPSTREFRAANDQLIESRLRQGPAAALDEFLTLVIGPSWHQVAEEQLPGSPAQMRRDTATFFDVDLPALLEWRFDRDDAARISCPVLYIGGTNSGRWFAEARELMLSWFSHAEDVAIEGADHSLALTHSEEIADALMGFLRRHPLGQ